MIESSKDILNLVLAFSVLWVAIFLSWFLFYLGETTKNINKIIVETEEKIHSLFSAIDFIRDKMGLLSSAVSYLVQGFVGRDGEKQEKKYEKTNKKKK